MNIPSLPIPNTSSISTKLRGGWLLLVRFLWLVLVIIALGLFIVGIPFRSNNLREKYQPKIGASFISNPSGSLLIFSWLHFPARQAGILDGDVLLAVNGKSILPIHDDPDDFLKDLIQRGPAGTPVRLLVRTGNHSPREYTILLGGDDAVALARLGLTPDFIATYAMVIEVLFALICIGIAILILVRKSNDWLALLASLTFILALLGVSENVVTFYDKNPLWRPELGIWLSLVLFILFLFACLFPVGQNVPRWTLTLIIAGAIYILISMLNPSFLLTRIPRPFNFLAVMGWLGAGTVVQIYHYRHSNPIQRQQTKWVILGAIAVTISVFGQTASSFWSIPSGLPTVLFDLVGYPAIQLFKLFLPITIAIAIFRYRLWDIDVIINRALVYGALTASVIAVYVLVVGALGTMLQARGNLLVSILATGLVAVLVQPLRDRLQRGVNRMMYGERDDPITVLSRLGTRLEATLAPNAVLPSLVETVAQALKLPYVAIELKQDEHLISQLVTDSVTTNISTPIIYSGQPQPEVLHFPLIYQTETIGQMLVAPRSAGETFNPMDHHLLENIARQAGMAVHAVSLTNELQQARQRLVTAVEEERRRLRRDLHDGLGPELASQGLKLAAAKQLLNRDLNAVEALLDQVLAQNQQTVVDVRRLVYGLRPPALDERGVVEAIRDHIVRNQNNGLQIQIGELPDGLTSLPAAVEVAVYRIALEALTNVIRHAQAKNCSVQFRLNRKGQTNILQLDVTDDGLGLPRELHGGVGLRSMRERAEELGGSITIESDSEGGTCVQAMLPLTSLTA